VDVPVPLRATTCGLAATLSLMETDPLRMFATLGVKVTVIVQSAAGARVAPQSLVCAKLADTTILTKLSVAAPELVTVTVSGWLVVATTWVPKPKLAADKETAGGPLVPNRVLFPLPPQPLNKKEADISSAKCLRTGPPYYFTE
jgi:hypothetical protein